MIYEDCPLVITCNHLILIDFFLNFTLSIITSPALLYAYVGKIPAVTLNLIITTVRKINFTRSSNGAGQSIYFKYIGIYIINEYQKETSIDALVHSFFYASSLVRKHLA